VIKPLKGDGTKYVCEHRFTDFQDKGKLTIIIGEKLFINAETKETHVKVVS
jgi:hypothetical protein